MVTNVSEKDKSTYRSDNRRMPLRRGRRRRRRVADDPRQADGADEGGRRLRLLRILPLEKNIREHREIRKC